MALPELTIEDISEKIPGVKDIGQQCEGGQKIVFPCTIADERYALKVMLTNPLASGEISEDISTDIFDEVTARARREVEIMSQCNSPHIVKIGPLPLTAAEIRGQSVIYFTEEWIEGQDLRTIIRNEDYLPLVQVLQLGKHITNAVKVLWSMAKIHRDIKPGNIMRRDVDDEFVLLDMGLAFDITDMSLTRLGVVVGTPIYFSPEQTNFTIKRQMDFRSDLFSLGIVLYEAATGRHPFWTPGRTSQEALAGILAVTPSPPSVIRPEIPVQLDEVIMRLLAKRPHMRYRTCDQLVDALDAVQIEE